MNNRYRTTIDPWGNRRTVEVDAHGNEIRTVRHEGVLGSVLDSLAGSRRQTVPSPAPPQSDGTIHVGSRRHEVRLGVQDAGSPRRASPFDRDRDPELDADIEAVNANLVRLEARLGEIEGLVHQLRDLVRLEARLREIEGLLLERVENVPAETPVVVRPTPDPWAQEASGGAAEQATEEVSPPSFFSVPAPEAASVPWFGPVDEAQTPAQVEQPTVRLPEL